jgi:uncharacterized membrane protein
MMAAAVQAEKNELIHIEAVAFELLRSLAGSIGLMMTIPLTAGIAAWMAVSSKASTQTRKRGCSSIKVSQ